MGFQFWNFFGTSMASSINSFSKTSKWILMIFGAKWSWESACFVSAVSSSLLLSRKQQTLSAKSKVLFFPCPASNFCMLGLPAPRLPYVQMINNWHWNIAYMRDRWSWSFLFSFQLTNPKISTQTEHFTMWPAGTSKSASGTRNENAYSRIRISIVLSPTIVSSTGIYCQV